MIKRTIDTRFGIATLNKSGYYEVEQNGKKVNLHKLVYVANYGEIPEGFTIHHKNGVKTDNDPKNLVAMPKRYHKLVHDSYNDDSKRGVKMNNKKLCKTIEKLQEGLNFAREELKELRENNERYIDNIAKKELLIAKKEKEIRGYIDKLNKLVEENKELAKKNEELRLVLLEVGALLHEAEDEITILNYEIRNKDKEISNLRDEAVETQNELKQLKKENGELKAQVEEDGKRIDSLEIFLEDIQDDVNQIELEECDLQVETNELIEDMDNLENSTFGFSEAGYNTLPETTKTELKENAYKAFELRLVDIKVRLDELKSKGDKLKAAYNWICERRQKLQLEGKL